jgi:hypothetical protein
MQRNRLLRAALMGAAVMVGSVAAPSAWADTNSFFLTQLNTVNPGGGPGPYVKVTVNETSSTTATITFDALSDAVAAYLLIDGGSAAVNVNGTATIGTISGTNSNSGFSPGPFSDGGSGAQDGFGSFSNSVNSFDSYTHGATEIVFTLIASAGTTWANAAAVLTPNNKGFEAAAHIAICSTTPTCDVTAAAINTVFASTPAPIVGAGLPALTMACGGLIALARRRRQKIA